MTLYGVVCFVPTEVITCNARVHGLRNFLLAVPVNITTHLNRKIFLSLCNQNFHLRQTLFSILFYNCSHRVLRNNLKSLNAKMNGAYQEHTNKGEFHFEPISVFVYIFAMDQSERAKRKNVNKHADWLKMKFPLVGAHPTEVIHFRGVHRSINLGGAGFHYGCTSQCNAMTTNNRVTYKLDEN